MRGRQQRQPIPEQNDYFTCIRYLQLNGLALEHWRSPYPGALRYLLQEPQLAAEHAIHELENLPWGVVAFDSDTEDSADEVWD